MLRIFETASQVTVQKFPLLLALNMLVPAINPDKESVIPKL